ncbi:MAG TPA: sulfatase [Gemmataceae bacterium]
MSSIASRSLAAVLGALGGLLTPSAAEAAERPNIVWVIAEDMSPHFSCYGEKTIRTPNVDALAARGVRFANAFTTAPVCSPSRSALVTGMYQTTIGAHHHRSGRGKEKIHLPSHVRLVPELFREAGYYVCNGSGLSRKGGPGKTDYNFEWDPKVYDGADWSGRKPGQPFFTQVQLAGGKLRHGKPRLEKAVGELGGDAVRPEDVTLPPYYPDDPVIREDWADYLDAVRYTDLELGRVVERLKKEGVLDNTVVFFITDHGISHARGKQFCYEEGIRIPFVVAGPGIPSGAVRDDLIAHIDMAATSLALAGIEVPGSMEGRDLFAKDYRPRPFVVSARDRCDETVDRIRSARTERYKYIRNFYPERPYLQPNRYKDNKEILIAIRKLHAAGKLNAHQSLVTAERRPPEELYDLQSDPFELNNLAGSPAHQAVLAELRGTLAGWVEASGDRGARPEPEAMYDSDMDVYLGGRRKQDSAGARELEANIALMKKWAAEGK